MLCEVLPFTCLTLRVLGHELTHVGGWMQTGPFSSLAVQSGPLSSPVLAASHSCYWELPSDLSTARDVWALETLASEAPSIPGKIENPILKPVLSMSISLWWRQSLKHFWEILVLSSHVCLLWQGMLGGSHQGHSEGVSRKIEPLGTPVALIIPHFVPGAFGFSWLPSWL